MADRNRYNRRNRSQDWSQRDDRNWRDQEEQFSGDRWNSQPDYEENSGYQMSEPHAGSTFGQRQETPESGWDRSSRYGQGGTGYARQGRSYSEGEYGYGPARYDTAPGWRGSYFTMNDQAGRDFNSRTDQNYGAYGDYGSYGYPGYGGYSGFGGGSGATYGYGPTGDYRSGSGYERGRDRNRRDWWDRTSDEVMSWFGDRDAAQRRRMDHTGRGPSNYTRSDDRIREDVNDALTDDWGVDASNVTVTVSNGEVTLDGTVATRLQKRRAEDCAEDVSGVKNVQNNLRVQERSTWDRSDSTSRAIDTSDT